MKTKEKLTYKKAGVDIAKGDGFIRLISPLARSTFRPEVMTDIGSFGALFKLNRRKYKNPVLVSGTDGVGTKLKIAFMADRHDTVGIDLVAMCVNDILTSGAEPLFFLDYFATGRLKPGKAAEVIKGIADGCLEAGCSLLGGETAEMPGFYARGEYDLSGFAVGAVEKEKIISGSGIRNGDVIIGIASNGLHSNGFSLVRKLFFEMKKMRLKTVLKETGISLGEELLKPTRIYVKAFNALKNRVDIKGMAHITGGGITGNLPRVLPEGLQSVLTRNSWPEPPIFGIIKKTGNLSDKEMRKTFNMGIGYILVVDSGASKKSIGILRKNGFDAYMIGGIEKGAKGVVYEMG
ncbi:MAG: phosphoribosylformylglycinamidine cyclo-ligase [Nitrospirota bacterium]|nr:phosphoribosylformylglycinamidine cyclo-ligase [Nitrospirota bacterium]